MSLNHISELPEVRDYNLLRATVGPLGMVRCDVTDAALAAADREVGRLRCCGNCSFWLAVLGDCPIKDEPGADRFDPCHFTPPRWTERITP